MQLLSQISFRETPYFIFLGGEPLLYFESVLKPLAEKINGLYKGQAKLKFSTNLTLLTPEIMSWIEPLPFELNISLDGSQKVHNMNRVLTTGDDTFDILLHHLGYIPKSFHNKISFGSTLTTNNVSFLAEDVDFFMGLFQEFKFQSLVFGQDTTIVWDDELLNVLRSQLRLVNSKYPDVKRNIPFRVNFLQASRHNKMLIEMTTGNINLQTPGVESIHPGICGNLNLHNFFHQDKVEQFHQEHTSKFILPISDLCQRCPMYNTDFCIPTDRDIFGDNINNFETYCRIKNILLEELKD